TVVVVGDVRELDVLAKMQAAYGAMAAASIPIEDTHPEPPQGAERRVTIQKATTSEKLMLGFHGPALGDQDHAMLTGLNEVLFGGRASRFHRALVIDQELASELRGWVSTFRDPGLYEMFVSARTGHTSEEIERTLWREIARVRDEPVTE